MALRLEQERLRLIFESATDYAIFSMNPDRRITTWNEGAHRMLGWTADEIVGSQADVLFTPEDREAGAPEWEAKTALTEGRATNERWHLHKDGSRLWGSGLAMPLCDLEAGPEAPPLGLLKILRDTTERRQAEERRMVLVNELNHRVKNTLAVVQSLAFQTVRSAPDPKAFSAAFQQRLFAVARAHDLLTREHWAGAPVNDIVRTGLEPFFKGGALHLDVTPCMPDRVLLPSTAVALAIALHELATNAVRHGSLSVPDGTVSVACLCDATSGRPAIEWVERGGPRLAGPPAQPGFGLRFLGRRALGATGIEADLQFEPDGLRCRLCLPDVSNTVTRVPR